MVPFNLLFSGEGVSVGYKHPLKVRLFNKDGFWINTGPNSIRQESSIDHSQRQTGRTLVFQLLTSGMLGKDLRTETYDGRSGLSGSSGGSCNGMELSIYIYVKVPGGC